MSKRDRKKKRRKGAGKDSGPPTGQPVPDPRAMEREVSDVARLLEEQEFESVEEASAFLQEMLEGGSSLPHPSRPTTPLEKAQDLIYQAYGVTGKKRVQLARKALRVSEDCADAYVLLAEETARDANEARELYEKGVEAGERALGQDTFEEDAGSFWGILETRPYMRARQGLAICLWKLGERQEAMDHYAEMLRLNSNDNQGIRYLLAHSLLAEDADEALGVLLDRYEDDIAASWTYTRALLLFRKEGASQEAEDALTEAVETNPFVPLYLLGQRNLPRVPPEFMQLGGDSEAATYVAETVPGWVRTPGALDWLRENMPVEPEAGLWGLDEDEEEEILAAMEAEERDAVSLLRQALPELRGAGPPSDELAAASGRLRDGLVSGELSYQHMKQAAGWETKDLPDDDVELWLDAAGALISPREETGLEIEETAAIMSLNPGVWVGAVIGLVRAGVGGPASPEDLVSYINDCPEVEGAIEPEDADPVEIAFKPVLATWEAAGAVDDARRLTALGRWGLPRALAWAWGHDFDAG